MQKIIKVVTHAKEKLYDITSLVTAVVEEAEIESGIVSIYVRGATAAIMIQENWDDSVQEDVISLMKKLIPCGIWQHDAQDNNGDAHLKAILAVGDLATLRNVYQASMVAMQAGADFIKTSTGKEEVNAALPYGLTMVRAIRDYERQARFNVGFKPAGGIRSAKDALSWLILMKEELGRPWLEAGLFRLGASSVLGDIERQLEHHVSGGYSASFRHALV